jgi:acetyl esterase/lipase
MASIQNKIIRLWFRKNKFLTNKKYTPQEMRARAEQMHWIFRVHRDVKVTPISAGTVPAEWLLPKVATGDATILYIHGGAWYMCSPRTHRGMVSHIAQASGVRALSIDYRLAPENPFPAALEDCVSAYEWLLSQGVRADQIVVAGDSAGGNLTLALLLALRDVGKPSPGAAVALSPATDMTGSGESYITRRDLDPILANLGGTTITKDYTGRHDLREPYISPLFADLHGLPAILIHVGDHEVLLDDARRFGEKATTAGVDIQVKVWPEMFHVFQLFVPWMPEARLAVQEIAAFIRAHTR